MAEQLPVLPEVTVTGRPTPGAGAPHFMPFPTPSYMDILSAWSSTVTSEQQAFAPPPPVTLPELPEQVIRAPRLPPPAPPPVRPPPAAPLLPTIISTLTRVATPLVGLLFPQPTAPREMDEPPPVALRPEDLARPPPRPPPPRVPITLDPIQPPNWRDIAEPDWLTPYEVPLPKSPLPGLLSDVARFATRFLDDIFDLIGPTDLPGLESRPSPARPSPVGVPAPGPSLDPFPWLQPVQPAPWPSPAPYVPAPAPVPLRPPAVRPGRPLPDVEVQPEPVTRPGPERAPRPVPSPKISPFPTEWAAPQPFEFAPPRPALRPRIGRPRVVPEPLTGRPTRLPLPGRPPWPDFGLEAFPLDVGKPEPVRLPKEKPGKEKCKCKPCEEKKKKKKKPREPRTECKAGTYRQRATSISYSPKRTVPCQ